MIEAKNLTKRYGNHVAVDHLTFTIEDGNIYGFLGPNGAGKTTTMDMLTGCLAATSGEVLIDGHDIFEESHEAKKLIGYLPELPPLYQDMLVQDYLKFVAKAKGVTKAEADEHVFEVMNMTQIAHVAGRVIKHLSKGYKQRVGIAQALVGNPKIIILDEPTVGLDPAQIIEIRELIKELGKEHTVILSSHILPEVRSVCNKIIIISHGKLMAIDTPENLERHFKSASLKMKVKASAAECAVIFDEAGEFKKINIDEIADNPGQSIVTLGLGDMSEDEIREKMFEIFSAAGKAILDMKVDEADLEDVFLGLTGEEETIDVSSI